LFNVLKAYAVHDKEVGYCQGMSEVAAFLLMYEQEEDAFWVMMQLLNNPKYNMGPLFKPGFPKLQESFWMFERLLEKYLPKLAAHLVRRPTLQRSTDL
jgi:hypothetical protein